MMGPGSLLTFVCLLAVADGQSSPSPATPSIISPSLGGLDITFPPFISNTCASASVDYSRCIFTNLLECGSGACESDQVSTGSPCDDLQASCSIFSCCSSCQSFGTALLACVAAANSCPSVSCAPVAPSPTLTLPPFNPAVLTIPPFSFPPELSLPPNLPSTGLCGKEASGWSICVLANTLTCKDTCANLGSGSAIDGCDAIDTSFCADVTCCDACADAGKAFAACMASLFQCSNDCGSFAPFAPTTVDYPSILSSLMPIMAPGVSMMPIMGSPSPVIESPSPTDASTSAPVAAPSNTTSAPVGTTAPVGSSAPVGTTAPVEDTSAPAASPTTANETAPTPVLGNGTKTQAPTTKSGAFAESTAFSAILAAIMGFAAFYHSVA